MKVDKDKIKKFFGMNGNQQVPIRRTVQIKNEIIVPKVEPVKEEKKPTAKSKIEKHRVDRVDYKKEFIAEFKKFKTYYRPFDIWRDFIVMFACALSNPLDKSHYDEREERYLNIIRKYPKEEQNVFPTLAAITVMALEDNPEQDFLGALFMELKLSNDGAKQIFTPYHMSELMAELTLDNVSSLIKKQGFITINDCCCGGGSTLIAAVNSVRKLLDNESRNFQNHVLVIAQDIDETVALMCYIQISLLGVAGYVKVGNALSEPMSPDDTIENYWFTPMYFSDVWVYRRVFRKIDEMTKGENKDGV